MNQTEAAAYLKRLNYQDVENRDEAALEGLVRAHLEQVPFENLDIYDFGKVPDLKEEILYEKVVRQKRGGYCFELNTLFCHLLRALGFSVYPVAARVLWNKERPSPATHMGLVVRIGAGRYFCDVGYGGPGPKGVTAMKEGQQVIAGDRFRVQISREDGYVIDRLHHGEWKGILCFEDLPVREVDFQVPNFYCAKNEAVMFLQKRLVNLCTPKGSKALTGMELTVREGGEVRQRAYADRRELEEGLMQEFGIRIHL